MIKEDKLSIITESNFFNEEEIKKIKEEVLYISYSKERMKAFFKEAQERMKQQFLFKFDTEKTFLFFKKQLFEMYLKETKNFKSDTNFVFHYEINAINEIAYGNFKFVSPNILCRTKRELDSNLFDTLKKETKLLQEKVQMKLSNDTFLKELFSEIIIKLEAKHNYDNEFSITFIIITKENIDETEN
ncbi:hypothetical protein [Fusobacterium necrophorum]|jgi:hypothetical protein|uniref:hypothetical protein n=1 Tax=Fusobacterium necrophorum TaxID=859 RepID=UPI00241FF5B6|nr:hypothetical protein [Fusobacterium necrophorum]MDK4525123.1 hypothetical protein [Fusobacterium necrophorum]